MDEFLDSSFLIECPKNFLTVWNFLVLYRFSRDISHPVISSKSSGTILASKGTLRQAFIYLRPPPLLWPHTLPPPYTLLLTYKQYIYWRNWTCKNVRKAKQTHLFRNLQNKLARSAWFCILLQCALVVNLSSKNRAASLWEPSHFL
jgi:hypothetical protein